MVSATDGAAEALRIAETVPGLHVTTVSTTEYRLTRVFRPTWATVLGWATAPTLIGLGFLLVRHTEVGTITVEGEGRDAVLRLGGVLPVDLVDRARAALDPPRPETGGRGSGFRTPPSVPVPGRSSSGVPRPAPLAGPVRDEPGLAAAGNAGPPPQTVLRAPAREPDNQIILDDGRAVTIGEMILIGRDPAPDPGARPAERAAERVAVADPGLSVSKTHVAVGVDERGIWVVDRDSTNGTTVDDMPCVPGERTYVGSGGVVRLGDRTFVVRMAGAGPAPAAEPTIYRRVMS
ncbi:MAG: FHA domain-containing protein [Dactylosporangium sp.]|nr:FHA domain-containing protein [Dactylosporangium sp.]NNJ61238.1 FHA domain-containing protein [Dactylosporangium sp.]